MLGKDRGKAMSQKKPDRIGKKKSLEGRDWGVLG